MVSDSNMRSLGGIAAIVGVGHTDWPDDYRRVRAGERPRDAVGYGVSAFVDALDDAGLSKNQIDGLIVGPTTSYERVGEVLGLDVRWGGSADAMQGILQACMAIYSGMATTVALVYGNNQRSAAVSYGGADAAYGSEYLSYVYHAPWALTSQGALYAMTMRRYMHETGFTERDLAEVAVAQRLAASLNPHAIMRKPISVDDYMASPYICEPLHLLDYCLVNDGGVALIITDACRAKRLKSKAVSINAFGRYDLNVGATSLQPRLSEFYRPAQKRAGEQMFNMAGVSPADVSSLQIYDSFSCHVPLALEGYGYCEVGGAARFIREEGISLAGHLPINTSGGHLSESYMQGWNHQIEAVRQLRGTCGDRQVKDCRFVHYSSDVAGKAVSILYGH
ncbi:thiolase family protein [Caballeronia catudaia]|uniref:Thiolase family protein n=1 Tax=Caballeronia catudaia TaxID=1777136 RepID=A0A158DE72_9BURK|nr:thiolase family protein [Caballeronia catudaia]SAK92905.1 thiolase family protein [Caballeronia catudaia]